MATNFEYYKDEIFKITNSNNNFAVINGKIKKCSETMGCKGCLFVEQWSCVNGKIRWLYAEYIEAPKLTKRERAFCEYVGEGYIARDQDGNLNWYDLEPSKEEETDDLYGEWKSREGCYAIIAKKSTFAFILWKDEKPWAVEDLLKLDVIEDANGQ